MKPKRKLLAPKVSAAEFQRAFGRFRELALQTPVAITNHGRESLILMSVAEYRRLMYRRAMHPSELDEETLAAIKAAEPPPETAAFNHEHKPSRRRGR
jgi:prevent-host-death family protein